MGTLQSELAPLAKKERKAPKRMNNEMLDIAVHMRAAGKNLSQIAEAIGMHPTSLGEWRPTIDKKAAKLMKKAGTHPAAVAFGDEY